MLTNVSLLVHFLTVYMATWICLWQWCEGLLLIWHTLKRLWNRPKVYGKSVQVQGLIFCLGCLEGMWHAFMGTSSNELLISNQDKRPTPALVAPIIPSDWHNLSIDTGAQFCPSFRGSKSIWVANTYLLHATGTF